MFSTAFLQFIKTRSGTVKNNIVEHFGAPGLELTALQTGAVVCPLGDLIRIKVTGRDRSTFLHNFCTNDIKGLAQNTACEAVFPNVKAHTIAHGYILAGESSHEIWMLPGDLNSLLKHLNRYIITEDVVIEAVGFDFTTFVVAGPSAITIEDAAGVQLTDAENANSCLLSDDWSVLRVTWNDVSTLFVSGPSVSSETMWNRLIESGATAAGEFVFQHHRILEGFPLGGLDITSENLAPEIGRVRKTISYTKGCYLGQEPIARIDAMGHVNRQLYRCNAAVSAAGSEDSDSLPEVTSISPLETQPRPALAMLNVKLAADATEIPAKTSDGRCVKLQIESLEG